MLRTRTLPIRLLTAAALVVGLSPGASGGGTQFTDVTDAAGVRCLQHHPHEPGGCVHGSFCEPERMSGGVAVGDVDGDGWQDLLVTRLDAPDLLFRNLGDGTFADVTSASGLDAWNLQSNGAAFADIDNDGDLDLFVVVLAAAGDPVNHRNFLFVNDGDGAFTEEAEARGADVTTDSRRYLFSVSAGDYDRDGWVDLHVNEWAPAPGSHSRLLRNLGAAAPGHFEDVTMAAGASLERVHAFASAFTDLDRDGWPDLAVAADFGTSRLLWNQGDGTFRDGTRDAGVGDDENGMGSTFGDIDGDGRLDWFVTSIFDPDRTCDVRPCNWGYTGNRLYRNEGGRRFSDATDLAGVRVGHWGWGTAFLDADNDRDLDLVMTNGVDFPGFDVDAAFNDDPMRFWENDGGGRMIERSAEAGLTDTGSGKGLAVFDYDEDGDLDVVLVNNAGSARLYRNDGGNARGWLRVRLVGGRANREGLGAWIEVLERDGEAAQVREMGASTHFLGQSERVAHFGLGADDRPVDLLRVTWPGGRVQSLLSVPRNATVTVEEASCRDADGDGFCAGIDCDDTDSGVQPRPESCDLADNDCDGETDEGLARCLDVRSIGYYRRLCPAERGARPPHPDGMLGEAEVECVSRAATFAGLHSVEAICDILAAPPRGNACAGAEAHLMTLLLNRCQGRVDDGLPLVSSCAGDRTVGAARARADAILSDPARTRTACEIARCSAEGINDASSLP